MCGLFGILNINRDQLEGARLALHTLSHRGPDQWNDWTDGFAYPAFSLWRLIKDWSPDVVHVWGWMSCMAAAPICRALNDP